MGVFDLPALWKMVQKETKVQRIRYVGHGQGFTQMMVSLAAYPEFYRESLEICIAIAPIMKLDN